jgi:MFS family permease
VNRNVIAISIASFLMAFGEELWKRFVPKYLETLGAPVTAVGFYGTMRDLLDGLYQYPGGWITDRYGRRRSLLVFIGLASTGYCIYLIAPSWPYVIAGLCFVMAWSSMANPTLFAVIGDALPKERRALGFTLQSMLRRIPIGVAAWLGGISIAAYGVRSGVRFALVGTLLCAVLTSIIASQIQLPRLEPVETGANQGMWDRLPPQLRRLLASDILIRMCEGMVDVLIVLYATDIIGITAPQYGVLVAVQMVTSILVYWPAARIADRIGRKPFVIATFLCFALYPISVVASTGLAQLTGAFIIGGLREIGEPSRKAMIVDFALPEYRGRTVGFYYLVRSLSITPAALIGALLWKVTPSIPFFVAGVVGLAGVAVFAVMVEEQYAG